MFDATCRTKTNDRRSCRRPFSPRSPACGPQGVSRGGSPSGADLSGPHAADCGRTRYLDSSGKTSASRHLAPSHSRRWDSWSDNLRTSRDRRSPPRCAAGRGRRPCRTARALHWSTPRRRSGPCGRAGCSASSSRGRRMRELDQNPSATRQSGGALPSRRGVSERPSTNAGRVTSASRPTSARGRPARRARGRCGRPARPARGPAAARARPPQTASFFLAARCSPRWNPLSEASRR